MRRTPNALARFEAFVFRHRNLLAAVPLVCAALSVRRVPGADWILWPAAAVLCFAGALVRAWARHHNTYAQGRRKVLARTGPYALVRNPLYIGNLLLITGMGVAAKLGWLMPGTIGWAVIVFAIACKHEERRLLAKYGEVYEAYRAQVPAWWPRALPESPMRIERKGFGVVLAVQVLQAFLCLAAFALIEVDLLRLWHPT